MPSLVPTHRRTKNEYSHYNADYSKNYDTGLDEFMSLQNPSQVKKKKKKRKKFWLL